MTHRHRILAFDDPMLPNIRRRILETWLKTIAGYLAMGGLIWGALALFGYSYHFQIGWGLLWLFLPIVMWWYSAKIALYMTKSVPADPNNPEHKRLIDIIHRLIPKTGLKHEPPVYISDNPLPNAFATGPTHKRAVVAATRGLFLIGLTDDEMEAVFAHEIAGHVKNYDVGINSLLAVLSMFFFMIVDAGVNLLFSTFQFFKRMVGIKPDAKPGLVGTIVSYVLFYVVFWFCGQLTKVVQMFVVRSRESGADASAALATRNPCALVTALEKLVAYVEQHRPKGREKELWRAIRPMMTIDPLYDGLKPAEKPTSIWQWLRAMYQYVMLTHPPVKERVYQLERMNGGVCKRS